MIDEVFALLRQALDVGDGLDVMVVEASRIDDDDTIGG
jgi:hypothetical protein